MQPKVAGKHDEVGGVLREERLKQSNQNTRSDYFIDKKCDIKLQQEQSLLGFNKPGGFYSVLVISISDEVVIAQDMKGNKHITKISDVLFIKEC